MFLTRFNATLIEHNFNLFTNVAKEYYLSRKVMFVQQSLNGKENEVKMIWGFVVSPQFLLC